MAANKLIFKDSEAAKNAIMATQKKEIAALYENWADEIGERAKYYSHKSTASSVVSERQMKELQKMLKTTSQEVSNEVYSKIKKNVYTISDAVVADNVKWLKSFGFSEQGLNAAFNYVPDEIVRNLITGQIYDSGWSLSQRIWSDNEQTLKDIYRVVAKGISENKPIYEIAKELEAYVRPEARLPWNLRAPDGVKIYKKQVDYNAQRLARTLVQHGYQQSFLATTQHNPFILEYIWRSNGSRVCKLCLSRDGVHYKKDELPMDHPNGMCTMIPDVADDMIDQLADWVNSPDGTFPEIDKFAKNFGYNPQKTKAFSPLQKKYLSPYGFSPTNMPKNFDDWSHKVSSEQASEILHEMGTSWGDPHPYQKLMKYYNENLLQFGSTVAKSGDEVMDGVKFAAKYGTSKGKTFNYWYTKLDDEAKAIAKELKDKSGLTWQQWYEKYIFKGTTKATTKTTVKKTTKASFDKKQWQDSLRGNNVYEMDKWTDEWLNTISSTERAGVVKYTSNAYDNMNQYLRGQRPTTRYEDELKACQSALSKASLPRDVITRRGSGYNMLNELGVGPITPETKDKVIGGIVQDKGFTSTSPAPHGGFSGDIEYAIKVPKGSQAMYVDSISRYQGEQELLINCGGKYIIEEVEFNSYGSVNRIYMTLINLR